MKFKYALMVLVGAGIALAATHASLEIAGYVIGGIIGVYVLLKTFSALMDSDGDKNPVASVVQWAFTILVLPLMWLWLLNPKNRVRHGSGGFAEGMLLLAGPIFMPLSIAAYALIISLCLGETTVAYVSGGILILGAIIMFFTMKGK